MDVENEFIGSYCDCIQATLKIGNLSFFDEEVYLQDYMTMVFGVEDIVISTDKEMFLSMPLDKVAECLDFIGYTIINAEREIEVGYKKCIERYTQIMRDTPKAVEAVKNTDLPQWKAEAIKAAKYKIYAEKSVARAFAHSVDATTNPIDWIMYCRDDADFGLTLDPWLMLRWLIPSIDNSLTLDLRLAPQDNSCEDCDDKDCTIKHNILTDFEHEKTIILTEGKSDSEIIQEAVLVLYPHLLKYLYFMDFEISNANGSTNFLTHYIKAFIGAGIKNKIIALYDNDTAARDEMKNFSKINIPDNIRILNLPYIKLAENYPTIGPFEQREHNVNETGVSIEFFL